MSGKVRGLITLGPPHRANGLWRAAVYSYSYNQQATVGRNYYNLLCYRKQTPIFSPGVLELTAVLIHLGRMTRVQKQSKRVNHISGLKTPENTLHW